MSLYCDLPSRYNYCDFVCRYFATYQVVISRLTKSLYCDLPSRYIVTSKSLYCDLPSRYIATSKSSYRDLPCYLLFLQAKLPVVLVHGPWMLCNSNHGLSYSSDCVVILHESVYVV